MYKTNRQIFKAIELSKDQQQDIYFVINDSILAKLGRKIENVSFIHDHKGKNYPLPALYKKVKSQLRKDKRTGELLKCVSVKLPQSDQTAVIIFSRGYCEPEIDNPKGSKKNDDLKLACT